MYKAIGIRQALVLAIPVTIIFGAPTEAQQSERFLLCQTLVNGGLFNTMDMKLNQTTVRSHAKAFCDYKERDMSGSGDIQLPVEGIPVKLGVQAKQKTISNYCQNESSYSSNDLALNIAIKDASLLLVEAFRQCIDSLKTDEKKAVQFFEHTTDPKRIIYHLDTRGMDDNANHGVRVDDFKTENLSCDFNTLLNNQSEEWRKRKAIPAGKTIETECKRIGDDTKDGVVRITSPSSSFVSNTKLILPPLPQRTYYEVSPLAKGHFNDKVEGNTPACVFVLQPLEEVAAGGGLDYTANKESLWEVNFNEGGSIRHQFTGDGGPQFLTYAQNAAGQSRKGHVSGLGTNAARVKIHAWCRGSEKPIVDN